jgi:hypothetical protein
MRMKVGITRPELSAPSRAPLTFPPAVSTRQPHKESANCSIKPTYLFRARHLSRVPNSEVNLRDDPQGAMTGNRPLRNKTTSDGPKALDCIVEKRFVHRRHTQRAESKPTTKNTMPSMIMLTPAHPTDPRALHLPHRARRHFRFPHLDSLSSHRTILPNAITQQDQLLTRLNFRRKFGSLLIRQFATRTIRNRHSFSARISAPQNAALIPTFNATRPHFRASYAWYTAGAHRRSHSLVAFATRVGGRVMDNRSYALRFNLNRFQHS